MDPADPYGKVRDADSPTGATFVMHFASSPPEVETFVRAALLSLQELGNPLIMRSAIASLVLTAILGARTFAQPIEALPPDYKEIVATEIRTRKGYWVR